MPTSLVADITRTSHEIMRYLKKQMVCPADDLHMGQLHALACVSSHSGMTMKEMADALHVSAPSATAFVDRLVALKYLSRVRDTMNRRIVRLKPTAPGMRMLRKKMAEKERMVARVLKPLPDSDRRGFLRILTRILENCKKY